VKHHILKDHVECGDILLEFIDTHNQLDDIFSEPLSVEQFAIYVEIWAFAY